VPAFHPPSGPGTDMFTGLRPYRVLNHVDSDGITDVYAEIPHLPPGCQPPVPIALTISLQGVPSASPRSYISVPWLTRLIVKRSVFWRWHQCRRSLPMVCG
jgi:hypothetical protein